MIGTHSGAIAIFNHKKNNLKTIISSSDHHNSLITALDISHDEEIILAGNASAYIEIFDLQAGVSLKKFKNIHQTPILSVKFFHDNTKSLKFSKALTSDNGSKLFCLTFEKGIFSYDCVKQLVIEKTNGQISQIELLKSSKLQNSEKSKDHKIFGLSSIMKVSIIQMEPKIAKIFSINRPNSIQEKNPPSISWTEGLFQVNSNEISIILMVSWGNHYFLVNLIQKEKDYDLIFSAQIIAHLEIENFAVYSNFVSSRILISFFENKKGILLNLEDFEEVNQALSQKVKEDNLDEILKEMDHSLFHNFLEFQYNENIVFNSFIKDSNNMARCSYFQSFYSQSEMNKILFIENEEIYNLGLFTWKKYINEMINSGDRFSALSTIIKVYKGEEKFVAGISEIKTKRYELMKEYSEIMIKDYLILALKKLDLKDENNQKEIKKLILTVIEFLIENDNSDYLFNEMQDIFKEFDLGEKFIENLEPFILKGKIR